MTNANLKTWTWYEWIGLASIVALIVVQFSSLYHTPIHNSYLWWGDESWLMNEYTAQLSTGIFRYPQAYGSTLNVGNPFPFTSMWVTSILYGVAGLIGGATTLIDAGRTLTAILSIGLLVTVFVACRKLDATVLVALLAVALLTCSRTFFFTSHSARYDTITALCITAGILLLLTKRDAIWASMQYLLFGVLWVGGLLVSVHVSLLLLIPATVFLLWKKRNLSGMAIFAGGAALSLGLLYLIHALTQPTFTEANNLNENLGTIPILRPFSRSVQLANLEQKLLLIRDFASVAGGALILLLFGYYRRNPDAKVFATFLLLPFIGWLIFQSAGPSSYLIHFLPCLIVGAALTVDSLVVKWSTAGRVICLFTILFAAGSGIDEAITAGTVGKQLTENNRKALSQTMKSDAPTIALNPAIGYLQSNEIPFSTAHFIELPSLSAERLNGQGQLVTFNSGRRPGFMWEVLPLRQEMTQPENVTTGYFLDVGHSYFRPLHGAPDTMFVQRVDLNELYTRHIR